MRWLVVTGAVLAVIVVPFLLFGDEMNRLAERLLAGEVSRGVAAAALAGLLAADVVLPVPSSVVSTGAGVLFGPVVGTIVSFAGMTAACLVGYALGRAGRPGTRRLTGEASLARVERATARLGWLAVVLLRPVPVLAEASVIFAGMTRMPLGRYLALTSAANLAISIAYAALGSRLSE